VSLWFENQNHFVRVLACCAPGFIVSILTGAAKRAKLASDLPFSNPEVVCCNLAYGIATEPIRAIVIGESENRPCASGRYGFQQIIKRFG